MSFKVEAFQNKYLPLGQGRVDAILSVTSKISQTSSASLPLFVGFIVDKSGSMSGDRLEAVKSAVTRAIERLDERAWFFVIAFDSTPSIIVGEVQATKENKRKSANAIREVVASGGTAMSNGLRSARSLFARKPDAIRQAIFLTDGKNESEANGQVAEALRDCEGMFECDCWGVGTDWRIGEVQQIAQALLGKASLIPDPAGIDEAFGSAIQKASAKALKDVRLRLWTPQGAQLVFVKQVNPTIEDMTSKAKVISPQVREFMTGAWASEETREFHIAVEVRCGNVGDEMLAARPIIVYLESPGPAAGLWAVLRQSSTWHEVEEKPPEARLFATWTSDEVLSSRLEHHVAYYTGQDELAKVIKEGLDRREKGDEAAATQLLGRAIKIAHATGNTAMTQRLVKVVDVIDASVGTVRLKRDARKAATMELELESRTTMRVGRAAALRAAGASIPARAPTESAGEREPQGPAVEKADE